METTVRYQNASETESVDIEIKPLNSNTEEDEKKRNLRQIFDTVSVNVIIHCNC